MRVYIAGPMTGLPNNNRDAFAYAWHELMNAGFEAISPHFLESTIEVTTRAKMGAAQVYRHVLPIDIFAMSSVDAVLALPGWENSRGAKFEKHFADLMEIPWVANLYYPKAHVQVYDIAAFIRAGIKVLKETESAKNSDHS